MGLADRLRELADEAEAMEARLMPDGLSWPIVDGQPVDFVTGYEPSLGVLEAVSIYSNGACEVMSHDGIIKGVKEIHVWKPKVLDADGVEIHVGDTVWRDDGEMLEVLYLRPDGLVDCCGEIERPERLTHERPDSWERLEEDARELDISLDGENTSDYPRMSCVRDLVRRCRALAERERGE